MAHACRCSSRCCRWSPSSERRRGQEAARSRAKKVGGAADAKELLKERLFELRKRGFNRLYQDGKIVEFSAPESLLELDFAQPVYILLDRIVVDRRNRARALWMRWRAAIARSEEVIFETAPRDGEPAKSCASPAL